MYVYVQQNEMEKKLVNEIKVKEELQMRYESLQKLIQVKLSQFDLKVSTS